MKNNILSRTMHYAKFSIRNRGIKYVFGEFFYIISKATLRKYFQPSLADFNGAGFETSYDGNEAILKILSNVNDEQVKDISIDFEGLLHELNRRLPDSALGLSKESTRLLYLLVRIERPICVLETGVANGISTYFILNALIKNNFGSLTSIDISQNVASFLTDGEKKRWTLRVLNTNRNPRNQYLQIIEGLQDLSIYLHDGDHSYPWQKMEYIKALNKLKPGGILLSDDVDSSYAFIDAFSGSDGSCMPVQKGILINRNKIFGYAVKKNMNH